eukprot:CAMPEP_0202902830 /NCGR_PEP_ID=MMETSP1392-20130828/17072_1 /ASSEMBLY_ACC=CAM_ASM_000868 /TAXON_ID=225041 /ORGANISM="Chlamydomonas chlamydogama, Strain SAG 11-48b" /LENGTH=275 /DNA_ID=CAMNT_0049589637 /DNA_START=40 /DNA_END=868 /DNA_ORIENTATION=+
MMLKGQASFQASHIRDTWVCGGRPLVLQTAARGRAVQPSTSSETALSSTTYSLPLQPRTSRAVATCAAKGFGATKSKGQSKELNPQEPCPCGSGANYKECCQPYHLGARQPDTPELLLRSRYVAYFAKNPEYIADTTHPDSGEWVGTRNAYLGTVKTTQKRMECKGLEVIQAEAGRSSEEAYMNFKVTFTDRDNQKAGTQVRHERSRFLRVAGRWYYLDSEFLGMGKAEEGAKETASAADVQTELIKVWNRESMVAVWQRENGACDSYQSGVEDL